MPYRSLIEALCTLNSPPVVSFAASGLGTAQEFLEKASFQGFYEGFSG